MSCKTFIVDEFNTKVVNNNIPELKTIFLSNSVNSTFRNGLKRYKRKKQI